MLAPSEIENRIEKINALHKAMDRILGSRPSDAKDERQVEDFSLQSLIGRRDAAARNLLAAGGVVRRVRSSGTPCWKAGP
jgi:hypothetical protein